MNDVRALIDWATMQLTVAKCSSPENDARILLAHILEIDRNKLNPTVTVPPEIAAKFKEIIQKRTQRIPLQHLTGTTYFRHLELAVGPGVFIPRPETELLVQAGLEQLASFSGPKLAVDLCTGSGAIALSMALESADTTVHAVEVSKDAFSYLEKNVAAHSEQLARVNSSVITYNDDATSQEVLKHLANSVDVVLSNPPYIPDEMVPRETEVRDHDPKLALYGGNDGLDVARKVSLVAANLLKPKGFYAMEHADVQGESAVEMLKSMNGGDQHIWFEIEDHFDYNQLPRFVSAVRSSYLLREPHE